MSTRAVRYNGPGGHMFTSSEYRGEGDDETMYTFYLNWEPKKGDVREVPSEVAAGLNHPDLEVLKASEKKEALAQDEKARRQPEGEQAIVAAPFQVDHPRRIPADEAVNPQKVGPQKNNPPASTPRKES